MKAPDRNSKYGYTLLEVIVVLALFAIILSIAIPNIKIISHARENDELNRLRREILSVRTNAIVENCTYRIVLDYKNNSYKISKRTLSMTTMKLIKSIKLENGLKFTDSSLNEPIEFKATGAPKSGRTIYLTNSKNQNIELTIAPATGSVNLKIDKIIKK